MKIDVTLLKRIHEAICLGNTGCPDSWAKKLGISRRFLFEIIEYLKLEFQAPIMYSRLRKTYHYTEDWDFYVGNLNKIKEELIRRVLDTINQTVKVLFLLSLLL